MGAGALEFRLRMLINAVIIILGFWAPWIEVWRIGRRESLVEWLSLELSRTGAISFGVATTGVIITASSFAALSVLFRVWGSAFLGPGTVSNANMIAEKVTANGPYRYVRNPLYIGLWFMVAAMAFLMPVTGALVAMILVTAFALRLTLGEEAFLKTQLGQPYDAYLLAVPRLVPRLRGAPSPSGERPHWLRAALTELTPIGVLVAIVVYSRSYDLLIAGRILLVFFGTSLVVRALVPGIFKPQPAK